MIYPIIVSHESRIDVLSFPEPKKRFFQFKTDFNQRLKYKHSFSTSAFSLKGPSNFFYSFGATIWKYFLKSII